MSSFISENVDICTLPAIDTAHPVVPGAAITIGDLHAHVIKALFLLMKQGVATGITAEEYAELAGIHRRSANLQAADITNFRNIISKLTFTGDIKVRFIGDMMADRCGNDLLTLLLLDAMQEKGANYEIIASNHDMELIEASELRNDFKRHLLLPEHAASMENMQRLIEAEIISHDEVMALINRAYKPKLCALNFAQGIIYTHAPTGLNTIEALATAWNIPYNDSTPEALTNTIDAINAYFRTKVDTNTVHELYNAADLFRGYNRNEDGSPMDLSASPFVSLLWNRNLTAINRPANHNGYQLQYAHGHDSTPTTDLHIFNLDNFLGKSYEFNEGEYCILYTDNNPLPNLAAPRGLALPPTPQIQYDQLVQLVSSMYPLGTTPKAIQQHLDALASLSHKAVQLQQHGHAEAARTTRSLCYALIQYTRLYLARIQLSRLTLSGEDLQTNMRSLTRQFQNECKVVIDQARPVLEKHRGLKQVLGNILLAVLGLGVFYLAAICINKAVTGNWLFFSQTDTAKQLDKVENQLESLYDLSISVH